MRKKCNVYALYYDLLLFCTVKLENVKHISQFLFESGMYAQMQYVSNRFSSCLCTDNDSIISMWCMNDWTNCIRMEEWFVIFIIIIIRMYRMAHFIRRISTFFCLIWNMCERCEWIHTMFEWMKRLCMYAVNVRVVVDGRERRRNSSSLLETIDMQNEMKFCVGSTWFQYYFKIHLPTCLYSW